MRERHSRLGTVKRSGISRRRRGQRARSWNRGLGLQCERLEDRVLLAFGPQLVSVQPNTGDILTEGSVLNIAPQQLTFVFDEGQVIDSDTLDGIRITRSGLDGAFDGVGDVIIQPGYVGIDPIRSNVVITRFAESLPDDTYLVEVFGVDDPSEAPPLVALRNEDGDAFQPQFPGTDRDSLRFELDLGAQVLAIVPQPVTTNTNPVTHEFVSLSQARNQIEVYFTDDDLDPNSASNPAFYQLIFTNGTVSNLDDEVFLPVSVNYDPVADKATLIFAENIGNGPEEPGRLTQSGTYRLRIGNDEAAPPPPVQVPVESDPGSSFDTAMNLEVLGAETLMVSTAIEPIEFPLDYPGAEHEPGHRQIALVQSHYAQDLNGDLDAADKVAGITTIPYIFRQRYGTDPQGKPLLNVITETQKQRAREVFEILGSVSGVQFLEITEADLRNPDVVELVTVTDPTGAEILRANVISVATGDIRALRPTATTGPGVNFGLAGPQLVQDELPNMDVVIEQFSIDGTPTPVIVPTAIMDNAELWDDSFGNTLDAGRVSWFYQAMHEIGWVLGLGNTDDLPPQNAMNFDPELYFDPSVTANVDLATNPYYVRAESVFPGDADIVHLQHLYRPESNDIDVYRFEITTPGVFAAETIAERRLDSSLLDTSLTLYRQVGTSRQLVARNDDYFSEDSLIRITDIEPGVYFLAVAASGNSQFDPTIEDTGSGGLTQGEYDLRLDFQPREDNVLRDETGVAFDGDGDGVPGGEYNFWFRAEPLVRTVFVDKSAPTGGDGSLARPFKNLRTALTSSRLTSGGILRVQGNGGADGDINTLDDNLAYEIGLSGSNPLADGSSLAIPRGVAMMVDEGAIFKMLKSNIHVGSSSVTIDRSRSVLQVLGTPETQVIFTSYDDESIGVDTNPRETEPDPGDWGGLIFQNDVDRAERRSVYEHRGVYLNIVNQADLRYGGGNVTINSVPQVINPIHLIDARPTITFNQITSSADAAMSANPNSFEETNFNAPDSLGIDYQETPFTSDYDRVGPDIRGNMLVDNSINGMFVRISTPAGGKLQRLTVTGRWDDTGIVHVVSENLVIAGTPGGPLRDAVTGQLKARTDAQLKVDPGITVKLDSSRIETGVSTQLLAEGLANQSIVFTSFVDTRFGSTSGTFQTAQSAIGETSPPAAGDWGGLYIGHSALGSFDYAHIAYGGGVIRVEGSFAGFNVVEVHQGDLRLTHSMIEFNANGRGGQAEPMREGRGLNDEGAIFVHQAQPVIVGNVIRGTEGNRGGAVSVNFNSLNYELLSDYGRATGRVQTASTVVDNHGPLVRDNRLEDNGINGMIVRGKSLTRDGITVFGNTLTTEGVWDDTDIVHVLFDELVIPDFHTFGGLRLESSPTESLVIKTQGATAGFTSSGRPLEIEDRIGGMLHVVGQPGHPVVLTSLADDSVGAGLDSQGRPQNDTDGGGRPERTRLQGSFQIDMVFGPQIRSRPQVRKAAEMAARIWERLIEDPITVVLDFELQELGGGILGGAASELTTFSYDTVRQAMIGDARPHETIVREVPSFANLEYTVPEDPGNPFVVDPLIELTYANAKAIGLGAQLPPVVSQFDPTKNRDADIVFDINPFARNVDGSPMYFDYDPTDGIMPGTVDFVGVVAHEIGHALGFVSEVDDIDRALTDPALPRNVQLRPLDLFRLEPGRGAVDFTNSARALDPALDQVFYDGGEFDPFGLVLPRLRKGDIPMSTGANNGDGGQASHWKDDLDPEITFTIGLMDPTVPERGGNFISPWDRIAFDLIGWDIVGGGIAGDWQGLTLEQYTHDRNVGVVTEFENPAAEAPESNGDPSTAQFIGDLGQGEGNSDDVLRLGYQVYGVVSSPSDVDVYSFRATAGTEVWLDIDRTSNKLDSVVELIDAEGSVLARSDNSFAEGQGLESRYAAPDIRAYGLQKSVYQPHDYWTVNPSDAGMRLVLPGEPGSEGLYHVRVRSSSPNIDNVRRGLTSGVYQLQLRLRELDELPGASIQYSDIRYATDGIRVRGMPAHSPLLGEIVEDASVNEEVALPNNGRNFIGSSFSDAQWLGNILNTDRATISIAGNIDNGFDVDWYLFQVGYDAIDRTDDFSLKSGAFMIDLDYADQLGRVDASIAIYEANLDLSGLPFLDEPGLSTPPDPEFIAGALLYSSRTSGDRDDLPAPLENDDLDDLSRGSAGRLDPMVGPISLTEGFYLLQVTSTIVGPMEHDQFVSELSLNPYVRVEPLNVLTRIIDDHIDAPITDPGTGPTATSPYTQPQLPQALDMESIVPFHLGDVTMFVATANAITTVDPFTGRLEAPIGQLSLGGATPTIGDFALRDNPLFDRTTGPGDDPNVVPRGLQGQRLHAYANDLGQGAPPSDATVGHYLLINSGDASVIDLGDDLLGTYMDDAANPGTPILADEGVLFDAMDFAPAGPDVTTGYAVGQRLGAGIPNILYRFRAEDGVIGDAAVNGMRADDDPTRIPADIASGAPSAGTDYYEMGVLDTSFPDGSDGGNITGISFVGARLFAVTDRGGLFEITNYNNNPNADNPPAAAASYIATIMTTEDPIEAVEFEGLTAGPQNVEDGKYAQMLFGMAGNGDLYAFDLDGLLQPVFLDGASYISTGVRGAVGVEFATLDTNMWHITTERINDPGKHPVGASFHFGEALVPPSPDNSRYYDFAGGAHGSLISKEFSLQGYSDADEPYVYFTYYLVTEDADGVDTFRVFVADDSREQGRGQWHLLASNSTTDLLVDNDPADDILIEVQPLFDNTWQDVPAIPDPLPDLGEPPLIPPTTPPQFPFNPPNGIRDGVDPAGPGRTTPVDEREGVWRQARISLADFAGSDKLRLRFDFSTAGSFDLGGARTTGGAELKALDGSLLRDGDTFIVDDEQVFEFDLGYTLAGRNGPAISHGEELTITDENGASVTLVMDRQGTGNGIAIDDSDSAEVVALKIYKALATAVADGSLTITMHVPELPDPLPGDLEELVPSFYRINFEQVASISQSGGTGLLVEGAPGVADGNHPIVIHSEMTSTEVAEAMVQPLADVFAEGNIDVIKSYDYLVRIIGHEVTDPGPLGLANFLPGDALGNFATNLRYQNNSAIDYDFPDTPDQNFSVPFEAVYVDDLIVGFESRGVHTIDFRPPAQLQVAELGSFDPFLPDTGTVVCRFPGCGNPENSIVVGEYDVAIRRATDYTRLGAPVESFDARDRFTQAVTLVAPAGSAVADGQTFTIGDGLTTITFEYDDVALANGASPDHVVIPFDVDEPAHVIAERIRDEVNTLALAGVLDLRAATSNQEAFGPGGTTNRIDLHGNVSVETVGIEMISYDEKGSSNVFRDQGQVIIQSNTITHSAFFGIVVEDGLRDLPCGDPDPLAPGAPGTCLHPYNQVATYGYFDADDERDHAQSTFGDYTPHAGSVRNLREINQDQLTAGVTITSNVIAFGAEGGIRFSGDPGGLIFTAPVIDAPDEYYEATDGVMFQITDVNGTSANFEIQENPANVQPGNIPIDWDPWPTAPVDWCQVMHGLDDSCQGRYELNLLDTADSIMEAILASNLDVTLYRGKGHEIYIEGAVSIALLPDSAPFALPNFVRPAPDAAVPFGRIVNNTIVGQGGLLPASRLLNKDDFKDVAIRVEHKASPTLLNNVIVNFQDGISVDNTARTTIVGASVYQGNYDNTRNIGIGDFAIELPLEAPLFVDRDRGNFYPAPASRIIDSSVDSVEDRSELVSVKDPLGISPSPILAPEFDVLGQKRIDDPRVAPPDGVGENVFVDRGAIDRVDYLGPTANLFVPLDNDVNDQDRAPNRVILEDANLRQFIVQLRDLDELGLRGGTGIDDDLVTSDLVLLRRDGVLLTPGIDYRFDYQANNDQILLSPQAGIWVNGHVYEIEILPGIRDIAGNALRTNENQAPFHVRFFITLNVHLDFDFGDTPDQYPTLSEDDGARHAVIPGIFLGAGVDFEPDAHVSEFADGDLFDDGVLFDGLLTAGATTPITIIASTNGFVDAWVDLDRDGQWDDAGEQILNSVAVTAGTNDLQVMLPATTTLGPSFARFRYSRDGNLGPTGIALDGEVEDYYVQIVSQRPWQNEPSPLDVNNDGSVVPLDALLVINELNNHVAGNPATGLLPNPPQPPDLVPEEVGYVDVDGDGFVTPRDALLIINALNSPSAQAVMALAEGEPSLAESGLSLSAMRDLGAAVLDASAMIVPNDDAELTAQAVDRIVDRTTEKALLWEPNSSTCRPSQYTVWDDPELDATDLDELFDDLAADLVAARDPGTGLDEFEF